MVIPENNLLCKVINGEKVLAASYSQIDTFVQCPYKWYKTYVEGNRSTEKHEATSYGTVIHQTMEYFFKNGCRPSYEDMSKADKKELVANLRSQMQAAAKKLDFEQAASLRDTILELQADMS